MNAVIEYLNEKRLAAGFKSHSAFARACWPEIAPGKAAAYWKRLRSAGGYKKPQRLQYADVQAICTALWLDVVRVSYEIEQLENGSGS